MTFGGKQDFDGFVPQKNKKGKNFADKTEIPNIITQAEDIVNSYAMRKFTAKKEKKRIFPLVAISFVVVCAVLCLVRII